MIEVEIPKDIRKYKNKVIGPFSLREAAGIAVAAISAFATYKLLHGLPTDVKGLLSMVAMAPGVGFGFVKLYGLRFEKLLAVVFVNTFVVPRKLLYKTKNTFEIEETPNIKKNNQKKYINTTNNPDFEKYI